MLIKVYGGTRIQEADSLCQTCRHSHIVRGRREAEEIVICTGVVMRAMQITFKVTECTEYDDQHEPSYHELYEQAWILRPASKRRPAGFIRPTDRERELRKFRVDTFDDE